MQVSASGPGILFDIHGHGRPEQWAMMGMLVKGTDLENNTFTVDQTSIKGKDVLNNLRYAMGHLMTS